MKTLSFGEVLWDVFPEYRKPGGSPANLAYQLNGLGCDSILLSRVGNDRDGEELIKFLQEKGLSTQFIQEGDRLPTGRVTVTFKENEPFYEIHEPSAWDAIKVSEELKSILPNVDAVCYASLSQRNSKSAEALEKILNLVNRECLKVFDLNLRPPYVNPKLIMEKIDRSDIIKLNEDEYNIVKDWYENDQFAQLMIENNPRKTIIITTGRKGSSMFTRDGYFSEPAHPVSGEGDFVGVGDAFLACFTYLKLKRIRADRILKLANRYAAAVASKKGGMPDLSQDFLNEYT